MLDISFTHKLSLHARHVLKEARDIARYTRSEGIEPRHLLLALTLEHGSLGSILLDNIGFEKERVGKLCLKKSLDHKKKTAHYSPSLAPVTKDILKRAYFLASHFGYPYVGTEHLVSALLEIRTEELDRVILTLNIEEKKINGVIESHLHFEHFPQLAKMFDMPDFSLTNNRTKEGSLTPFLDQYATDLGRDPLLREETLIGRTEELERLMQILGRRQKNNALLIGEPGVGKTALVAALAKKIERGEAGPILAGKRILSLDLTLLVAGTSFRGEFETRIKEVLREARENKNLILFIDEIHTLIGTGNTNGGLDAANILKPALSRGEIQCIGATTFAEYKRYLEKDAALERRFQTLQVNEPSVEMTKHILQNVKHLYENHHELTIPPETVDAAVDLSLRYLTERFLPDKAFDLLDEAASLVRRRKKTTSSFTTVLTLEKEHEALLRSKEILIEEERYDEAGKIQSELKALEKKINALVAPGKKQARPSHHEVTPLDILRVVAQMTGIPFSKLSSVTPAMRLANIRSACEKNIIGQKEVIDQVLATLTRSVSGINDPHRPLGSFLFLGPTGVGKTHVAKILAKEFFGDERALIRLDMSEFMERHSVAQILGSPAGYVGYGEGGKLTEQVRRRPYAVVLFDEIEKAHPDVFNLLLQILDEGTLTDAEGRKVSFKNTLIILTSNIGTTSFTQTAKIGFGSGVSAKNIHAQFESIKREVLDELKKTMRPELIGRLNNTIVFNALDEKALEKITTLELAVLKERLGTQGKQLRYGESLVKFIAEKSFAPEQGARLVRKNVQDIVEHAIATKLLAEGKKKSVTVSVKNGKIITH
ncbi:MAG: ATP-dependent Clp protease ATP-binding subunit [Candidatus Moraniibacteriota bacterium]